METERLYFRKYKDEDLSFLLSMVTDPETVRYIGEGKVKDGKEAKEFLQWIYRTYEASKNRGLHVLVRKTDEKIIGHAGLVPQWIEGTEELEIGYWIARDYWGKGYATEAAAALLNGGRTEGNRLISLIQSGNTASQRVAEKIGMEKEKLLDLAGKKVWIYKV